MGVHQFSLFGETFEYVGNRLYRVQTEPAVQTVPTEVRIVGDACRSCNRYENSDGMYGAHCGNCDCCN